MRSTIAAVLGLAGLAAAACADELPAKIQKLEVRRPETAAAAEPAKAADKSAEKPSAGPAVTAVETSSLGDRIKLVLATRDPHLVSVMPLGQMYHRHDHLLVDGVLQKTPEAAIAAMYVRCPECLPPTSTEKANEESSKGRTVSRYYTAYLQERVAPSSDQIPPGTDVTAAATQSGTRSAAAAAHAVSAFNRSSQSSARQ